MDINDSGYNIAFVEYKVKVLWIHNNRKTTKRGILMKFLFFPDMVPLNP